MPCRMTLMPIRVRHHFHQPDHEQPQRKQNEIQFGRQRDRKNEKQKWIQTVLQPFAPPGQPHQRVNAREHRNDGNERLLDEITQDMQQ